MPARELPDAPRSLVINSPATQRCQTEARHQLEQWLLAGGLLSTRIGEVVLAASEALSNVVRHAYRARAVPGPMCLTATLADSFLSVSIQDEGSWRGSGGTAVPPSGDAATGGWGLQLMRGLSESLVIDHLGGHGTNVTARYDLTRDDTS